MTRHKLPAPAGDASRQPRLFALSSSLAVLQADATVHLMPFQRNGLPRAGWIMASNPFPIPPRSTATTGSGIRAATKS